MVCFGLKLKCFVNGFLSKICSLQLGVPQGTILGLLFSLYTNDLPNCLYHSQPRMYADDTHLTCAGVDVVAIQDCLNIRKWLVANKLTFNMAKTEFVLIGSRQRLGTFTSSPALVINGAPVNQVSTSKSLGVLIDENLTRTDDHIDKLAKRSHPVLQPLNG